MTEQVYSKNKQKIGKEGEKAAAAFLEDNGYLIIDSNYKGSFGEIDLIAKQNQTIVFVEVKLRHNTTVPLQALVSPSKQYKIIQTAKKFIHEHQISNMILRFDVILIKKNHYTILCDHIESAFLSNE